MPNKFQKPVDPFADFATKLQASLVQGTFVRLTLSHSKPAADKPERILARCIELKGDPHVSVTLRWPTRDEVRNFPVMDGLKWLLECMRSDFPSALLCTTSQDWQLSLTGRHGPKLIRHKASQSTPPARAHDQGSPSILNDSACDWSTPLGLTDARGKVCPGMAHKFTQVNRYLEIFSHLALECGWPSQSDLPSSSPDWTLVDMGCGKAYLTFGLWHFCRRLRQWPVKVVGVESRPELVAGANRLAGMIQAQGLEFVPGTIESVALPNVRALIALHACDTATDAAILRGVDLGAQLIILAPCCHKELRPQIGRPTPFAPLLQHGLLLERMAEWTTDGLRALFLEWAGYRTKVFEFVGSEHTPKNLMIAGIRERPAFAEPRLRQQIESLKSFFAIARHSLDPLLARTMAHS